MFCVSAYAKPRFATFVKYGKVELIPPTPAEIPQAIAQASNLVKSAMTFRWTQLSVKVKPSGIRIRSSLQSL